MKKKTLILIALMTACLFFSAAGKDGDWDGKGYDELKETLLGLRGASPEKALELSLYLIQKYPDKEVPYGIAYSLYSLKKSYSEAENMLQSAIRNLKPNDDYYIKLARFYRRVNPEKIPSFIETFTQNEKKRDDYHLVLAKIHIVNQEDDKAIAALKEAADKGELSISTVKLLMNLLVKKGRNDELWGLLDEYIKNPNHALEKRIEFFQTLLSSFADYSRDDLVKIINFLSSLVKSVDDYPLSKKTIQESIQHLIGKGKGKELEAALEKEKAPLRIDESLFLIYLSFLQETGEYKTYFDLMKTYDGTYPFIMEEKARFLEQDGDTSSAANVLETLAGLKPDNKRITISLAQFYNRYKRNAESQAILDKIPMTELKEKLLFLHGALTFDNLTNLRRFRDLVEKWIEAGKIFEHQHLETYISAVIGRIPETDDHLALMTIVDEYLTTGSLSEPPLLLFKIHLAEEIRDYELYFNLADRYLSIQKTFSSDIIYPYTQHAMRRGMKWVPVDDYQPPGIAIINEQLVAFAEKWILKLIEKNPIVPQYHVDLIYIRRAQNREQDILNQIEFLEKDMKNDPERVHLTAYVLATSGFAEKAIPYYEKAIRLKPDIVKYKMNYGGSLIRTRQYQKAVDLYKDVITGGYTAKTWNLGEVLRQVLHCYDQMGKPEEFFRLLDEIKSREDIPREDIYMNAGVTLYKKEKYDDAIRIVQEFISGHPDNEMIYNAHLLLADIYSDNNQHNQAIAVYKKCQNDFKEDRIRVIDCLYNIAEMERKKGDVKEAIRLWKELAAKYPDDEGAQNALVAAAEAAETDLKDVQLARELYQAFLDMNPKDGLKTLMVKYKLELTN